jgi:hypothetical protein
VEAGLDLAASALLSSARRSTRSACSACRTGTALSGT